MAGWLLLIVLICLHNQLISILSINITDVWEMWFIKSTVKMNGCFFQQVLRQNFSFCLNTGKLFCRGLIPTERAWVFLKNGTRDFQINPPFERSACFYVTSSENFEHFQCFNFETDFLENQNFSQKTGVPFFSWTH